LSISSFKLIPFIGVKKLRQPAPESNLDLEVKDHATTDTLVDVLVLAVEVLA
jgi:hypothetical protein